jgi:hypothetical protein
VQPSAGIQLALPNMKAMCLNGYGGFTVRSFPFLAAGVLALSLLGACATATPYQAATNTSRGFSEQKIEANRYTVEFAGNSLTDRKTVETYLLFRAAELTRQNGYDHFRVATRGTDANSRLVPIGGAGYAPYHSGFGLSYRYYGPHAAYFRDPYRRHYGHHGFGARYGYYDPFWNGPSQYREVTSYVASAEIIMGKGAKPDDAAFFDAEQVMFNLATSIVRPEA